MRYVIAYDITADPRRDRVAKTLEGFGRRIQYSVFECDLAGRELVDLLEELERIVNSAVDQIRLYRLCTACAGEVQTVGPPALALDPDVWIV